MGIVSITVDGKQVSSFNIDGKTFQAPVVKSALGKSITLNDVKEGVIKELHLWGKATQTQYHGYNLVQDTVDYWESGQYAMNNGVPTTDASRIRLKNLVAVEPSTMYFCQTNYQNYQFVIREYNASEQFLRSVGAVSTGNFTTSANTSYVSVTIYSPSGKASVDMISTKQIKPYMGKANTYEPYCGGVPSPSLLYTQPIIGATQITVSAGNTSAMLNYTLYSLPTVRDNLVIKSDGTGYIARRCKPATVTFRKEINTSYKYGYRYTASVNNLSSEYDVLCTKLLYSPSCGKNTSSLDGIRLSPAYNTIVAQFFSKLDTFDLEIVYGLATPNIENLTQAEVRGILDSLALTKPTCVITNDKNLDMGIFYFAKGGV